MGRRSKVFPRYEALLLHKQGLSYGQISKRLRVPKQTVADAIKKLLRLYLPQESKISGVGKEQVTTQRDRHRAVWFR